MIRMLTIRSYSLSKIAIIGIVCISLILLYFSRGTGGHYRTVVAGDGNNYYSYLVSIFINKDLAHQDLAHSYIRQTPTGNINVHTAGVALLLLPFFLIGYVWAFFSNTPLNGFSEPFEIMVSIGALFYLVIGLIYLRRLLLAFTDKDNIIALVLILIFFGTNLMNYAVQEPSMSHVYSFALLSAFLFYVHKIFQQPLQKYLCLGSLIFGLILLVRPVNAIIVLVIPFFASSFNNFKGSIKYFLQHKKSLILPVLCCISIVSIQSIIWYIQNGKILQWSYRGAGFYPAHPHTWQMLFGFDSGFFIYTPLCFLILSGLVPLFIQNKFRFFILFFFIAFSFYLFSAYCLYTYYDGLGIRTFVDFYSVFSILLTILLTYITGKKIKYVVAFLIAGATLLNLVYSYQYKVGIMAHTGMNFKKYKYIFLKTDKSYMGMLGGSIDLQPYSSMPPPVLYSYTQNEPLSFNNNEFGLIANIPLNFPTNVLYVKIKLKRKEESANSSFNAYVVIQIESETGVIKKYQAYRLNDIPSENSGVWEDMHYEISIVSQASLPTDKLSVYIWNQDKKNFSIRDYSLLIYNYTY